jgi:hypothetical protein
VEVVVFDSVPPPLTDQVTPAAFLSFVTTAVSVVASVASTVVLAAVTATLRLAGVAIPPHPDKHNPKTNKKLARAKPFRDIQSSGLGYRSRQLTIGPLKLYVHTYLVPSQDTYPNPVSLPELVHGSIATCCRRHPNVSIAGIFNRRL